MRTFAILTLFAVASGANAEPFEGSWVYDRSGYFSLELIGNRDVVCGQVTSISGQRVDASWIIGRIEGERATVQFASGFGEGSARGTATMRPNKSGMEWRVLHSPPGESWIFEGAHADAVPWAKGRRAILVKWCSENWSAIEQGSTSGIELRP